MSLQVSWWAAKEMGDPHWREIGVEKSGFVSISDKLELLLLGFRESLKWSPSAREWFYLFSRLVGAKRVSAIPW